MGGNAKLGITGYGATNFWHSGDLRLDFQESARTPAGGPFGAIGADAEYDLGKLHFFLEGTRSFDSSGTGGDIAALQRTTFSLDKHELELSFRYFGRDFANPYARPIAAADEFEGSRSRNEVGGRLRYRGKVKNLVELRGQVDLSTLPYDVSIDSAGTTNLDTYARVDVLKFRGIVPSAWVIYRNRNLGVSTPGGCYDAPNKYDANGVLIPCTGQLFRGAAKVEVSPLRDLSVYVQYQQQWLDDPVHDDGLRTDLAAIVGSSWRASDALKLSARVKYLDEDLADFARMETSIWGYLSGTYRWSKALDTSLRYDVVAYLDGRDSTVARPSPLEHRFRLELEARF